MNSRRAVELVHIYVYTLMSDFKVMQQIISQEDKLSKKSMYCQLIRPFESHLYAAHRKLIPSAEI